MWYVVEIIPHFIIIEIELCGNLYLLLFTPNQQIAEV